MSKYHYLIHIYFVFKSSELLLVYIQHVKNWIITAKKIVVKLRKKKSVLLVEQTKSTLILRGYYEGEGSEGESEGTNGLRVAYDKAWELIGPDVAFCTRSVLSPLLLGLYIPVTLDTRNTTHVLCYPCSSPPIYRSLLCSLTSTLSRTAVNGLSLCGFRNSYDFMYDRSCSIFIILRLFISEPESSGRQAQAGTSDHVI